MEILVTRKNVNYKRPDGLVLTIPALFAGYNSQEELLKKLPLDCVLSIKTKVPRNLKLHRQIWAVINYAFDNMPPGYEFRNINIFVDWMKLKVGFTEVYKVAGQVRIAPRSISFSQCDENLFQDDFYNPATELMAQILGIEGKTEGTQEFSPAEVLINDSKEYNGIDYRSTPFRAPIETSGYI